MLEAHPSWVHWSFFVIWAMTASIGLVIFAVSLIGGSGAWLLGLVCCLALITEWRCLFGFPHPSGANAQRARQFSANKTRMKDEIVAWSATL